MLWQKALALPPPPRTNATSHSKRLGDCVEPVSSTWKRQRPFELSSARFPPAHTATDATEVAHVSSDASACDADESADMCDENEDALEMQQRFGSETGRRLWDASVVYPMGVRNWSDTKNCAAALVYECPCGMKCLSSAGSLIDIYEHRRKIRALAEQKGSGGLRDTVRRLLAEHYDGEACAFTPSFVVGKCARACDYAFAIGSALSEITFARARTDVVKNRGWHTQRLTIRHSIEGSDRRQLDGWVRLQKDTMEGDKISGDKWFTEKTTEHQLWSRYVASCDRAKQPTVGNSRLLFKIWKEHAEYKVVPPTGHAICTRCGDFASRRLELQGTKGDARTRELLKELDEKEAAHKAFHSAERRYYDDAVARATHVPTDVTTITIDAPTRHQFDLPSQARVKRDTVKRLDGSSRWQSKLEGVLDAGESLERVLKRSSTLPQNLTRAAARMLPLAGVGMFVYIAREALGGGPNLVGTVLIMSLLAHIEHGRPLGRKLHLQLDNTSAENKNLTIIGLVALLVAWGVFSEASIFFMTVGHTYNELDAAFAPLIDAVQSNVLPTMSALLELVPIALAAKRVRVVQSLPHLWDFSAYFKQYMHPGIGGFTVTQQSSGMHEFHLSCDSSGEVRMKTRQSSQSSTWFPEGAGDPIFKSVPDPGTAPPIAKMSSDVAWERASVFANVRRWLPFLGLSPDELNRSMAEWERVFDSLPPDGDITRLREDQKLAWVAFEPHADVLNPQSLRCATSGL